MNTSSSNTIQNNHNNTTSSSSSSSSNAQEVSHYVVTAHPPGAVLDCIRCNFLAPDSLDVLIAKSGRIEVRQLRSSGPLNPESSAAVATSTTDTFPCVLQFPIHGRVVAMRALHNIPGLTKNNTAAVFILLDRQQYAVISYDDTAAANAASSQSSPYPIITHVHGRLNPEGRRLTDQSAPIVAIDKDSKCIALHIFDGLITVIPILNPSNTVVGASNTAAKKQQQVLGAPFDCRIEEHTILDLCFLDVSPNTTTDATAASSSSSSSKNRPLAILYQDARGTQHLTTHVINLSKQQLHLYGSQSVQQQQAIPWIKKNSVDGGSSMLIPVTVPSSPVATLPSGGTATTVSNNPTTNHAMGGGYNNNNNNNNGGVIILGQRQFTYCSVTTTKVLPVPQGLFLTYTDELPPDERGNPRYLIADELGNLHMLQVTTTTAATSGTAANNNNDFGIRNRSGGTSSGNVVSLSLETLGSCTLSTSMSYLGDGLLFVGSALGDSQLVQIHDQPIPLLDGNATAVDHNPDVGGDDPEAFLDMTTYLSVLEEYTNLGPILDFDLVPTAAAPMQSQVVTASGSSKLGSLRVIRNGIGMNEYASVEIPGIQAMWSLRKSVHDVQDSYLVQSFVGETRILGVTTGTSSSMMVEKEFDNNDIDNNNNNEEEGGTLEEVVLSGFESNAGSLYVGNIYPGDRVLQITESHARLIAWGMDDSDGRVIHSWSPNDLVSGLAPSNNEQIITVATANEAGQIAVALQGGMLVYLKVEEDTIVNKFVKKMEREVSCIDVHPFSNKCRGGSANTDMDIDSLSPQEKNYPVSTLIAVGLWDDFTVRLLSIEENGQKLEESVCIHLCSSEDEQDSDESLISSSSPARRSNRNHMMARSLCLITLDFSFASSGGSNHESSSSSGINMLFVGLGDGTVISFAVVSSMGTISVQSRKEVCLGMQRIDLVPLSTEQGGRCILATGDRPTVIYLAGVGGTSLNQFNPKLCYSHVNLSAGEEEDVDNAGHRPIQRNVSVNVATPFYSSLLFEAATVGNQHYSLCVADDANLRLGVIDDIQKLHVTTCRLGMAPRRIVHCQEGRLFAVGCIESGIQNFGLGGDEANMGNCIRFMDDTTFDDIQRVDLEPYEMILAMEYATLSVPLHDSVASKSSGAHATESAQKPFLLVGTAYALPDEDEPTRGRILVYSCQADESSGATSCDSRAVRHVTELSTEGGVYSICQFYDGKALATVNSRTHVCHLVDDAGLLKLQYLGLGHFGHILSLFVKSRARRLPVDMERSTVASADGMAIDVSDSRTDEGKKDSSKPAEMLAIVGDLMRSISLVQYYPEHQALEEVARDFNANWVCAVEMLNDSVYLGAENWNNLFCLRRNKAAASEEIRCRLDTIGEYHLGEMCNKFMSGSLVMPVSTNNNKASRHGVRRGTSPQKKIADSSLKSASRVRRPVVVTGSQTLFGTVDGTLGVILGLDGPTAAFLSTLERAMEKVIKPVGNFSHRQHRACHAERRVHPAHGFVDGDLVEGFLDLDRATMEAVVMEMNRVGGWEMDDAILRQPPEQREKSTEKEDSTIEMDEGNDRPDLLVDDVLAMVEEMVMLH